MWVSKAPLCTSALCIVQRCAKVLCTRAYFVEWRRLFWFSLCIFTEWGECSFLASFVIAVYRGAVVRELLLFEWSLVVDIVCQWTASFNPSPPPIGCVFICKQHSAFLCGTGIAVPRTFLTFTLATKAIDTQNRETAVLEQSLLAFFCFFL